MPRKALGAVIPRSPTPYFVVVTAPASIIYRVTQKKSNLRNIRDKLEEKCAKLKRMMMQLTKFTQLLSSLLRHPVQAITFKHFS